MLKWMLVQADIKAFHTGNQFNLDYVAGLDICCVKFIEHIKPEPKNCAV